jgi:hypothetical protein
MNEHNYASREAAERLEKAGIVLETDHYWYKDYDGAWKLSNDLDEFLRDRDYIPAVQFAEIWREFPECVYSDIPDAVSGMRGRWPLEVTKGNGNTVARYFAYSPTMKNINPADALIDLLIWERKEKP